MNNKSRTKEIYDKLTLSPHPEGGFYKVLYCSEEDVKNSGGESRNAGTSLFQFPKNIFTAPAYISRL